MEYAQQQQGNPARRFGGVAFVIALHALLVYALVNGLARKLVEVVKGPLETRIIQELKPPAPEPPPPPPKLLAPPPPFIPPPEVNIAQAAPAQNAITAVSSTPPPPAQAPVQEPPKPVQHLAPVVRSSSCREPEYPAAAARLGETGEVVLALLVGVNGRVVDSRIEKSSGSPRLDQAARQALTLCQFTPGSVDGQPEEAWGRIAYAFKSPDQ